MSSLTIEIPADIRLVIQTHTEIDWKEIAQRSLYDYARKLVIADNLTQSSSLTEDDVQLLGKQIKENIAKKYI